MSRLDKERQNKLEPKKLKNTKEAIENLGYEVSIIGTTELNFIYKDCLVKFFPYSGWHTGKSIVDGRGFKKLINQIDNAKPY